MNLKPAILIPALLTSGCSSHQLEALSPFAGPDGTSIAPVEIDSSPTTAWVYVDGQYVGNTPLVYGLSYDSSTETIEVIAEPLPAHRSQVRQTKHIKVPPLPRRIHFFLNNPESHGHDS